MHALSLQRVAMTQPPTIKFLTRMELETDRTECEPLIFKLNEELISRNIRSVQRYGEFLARKKPRIDKSVIFDDGAKKAVHALGT
jgi:hypothetical protein